MFCKNLVLSEMSRWCGTPEMGFKLHSDNYEFCNSIQPSVSILEW